MRGYSGIIRLEYVSELKSLNVSILNPYSQTLENCFVMPIELKGSSNLVISASSGASNPDFHEIHSIKVYDTSFDGSNNVYEDVHKKKAD
jgi:hypothetical protein